MEAQGYGGVRGEHARLQLRAERRVFMVNVVARARGVLSARGVAPRRGAAPNVLNTRGGNWK